MASGSTDHIDEGRLDLVPMIDCVMLLLLFFILTTHFTSEDQRLSAILPARGGTPAVPAIVPPPQVDIVVLPAADGGAEVRLGGHEPVPLHPAEFGRKAGPELAAAIDAFHRAIAVRLEPYERPGDRAAQVPVEIHCATRLPWTCALAVYDAVRGYEQARLAAPDLPFDRQRAVAFGGPTVRGSAEDGERAELERLGRMR